MFGTLLPELRKAMRFDKADPYALFGVYVGNTRLSPMWKLAYVGGIKYFGAGMIDEVKVFMNAPIAGSSVTRSIGLRLRLRFVVAVRCLP